MSEVDRLSNSGLYPALPIADGRRDKGRSGKPVPERGNDAEHETAADSSQPQRPRKSLIDEYV